MRLSAQGLLCRVAEQNPANLNTRTFKPAILATLWALVLAGCASQQPQVSPQPPPVTTDILGPLTETGNTAGPVPQSATVDRLRQVFERYQGVPYQYGGTTPKGFDCSGFIRQAFAEGLDRHLPRTTREMLSEGRSVPQDQLRVGDLVFFNIRGREQHAGIYMGGDRFIHASTSVGVTESSLNGLYWRGRFTQARRFD